MYVRLLVRLKANINEGTCSTPPEGDLSTNVVDGTSASNLSRLYFYKPLPSYESLVNSVLCVLGLRREPASSQFNVSWYAENVILRYMVLY